MGEHDDGRPGGAPATVADVPEGHRDRATSTLTTAFTADRFLRWMYPGAEGFLAHLPDVVHEFGGQAYTDGVVREVGSYAGVALWMPPGSEPGGDGLLELYRRTIARVRGDGEWRSGASPPVRSMQRPAR